MAENLYAIFGVARDCSFAELKKAYYAAAKRCHPDRFANAPEKTEEFKRLVAAFNTLSDPELRRRYDIASDPGRAPEQSAASLLDSEADDILEELIVGNDAPPESSLATLMRDLTKTEIFVTFREGRNHLAAGRFRAAEHCFFHVVSRSPQNILYRVHLARAHAARRRWRLAAGQYQAALGLGRLRVPPQSMFRVRAEYEAMRRRSNPLAVLWDRWFGEKKFEFCPDPTDLMVAQLNRRIAAEMRKITESDRPKLE